MNAMLRLLRFASSAHDTLGALYLNGKFICFTLEDRYRDVKVAGETRIPAGIYSIDLRTEGGLNDDYSQRFSDIHRGMLWLRNVPDFEYVYIHCGNKHENTKGCILVGDTLQQNVTEDGYCGHSSTAYRRIYPVIAQATRREIHIEDYA